MIFRAKENRSILRMTVISHRTSAWPTKSSKTPTAFPPELELRKEIRTTEALLAGIQDTQEKYKQMKKLNYLIMKLNMTRHTSMALEENQHYFEKVVDKIGSSKKRD